MRKIGLTWLIGVSSIVLIARENSATPLPRSGHAHHLTSSHHAGGASHLEGPDHPHPHNQPDGPDTPHHKPHDLHPHHDPNHNGGSELVVDHTGDRNPTDVSWANQRHDETSSHQQHADNSPDHTRHAEGGDSPPSHLRPSSHNAGDHPSGQHQGGEHHESGSGGSSDGPGGHEDGRRPSDDHTDEHRKPINEENYDPADDFGDSGGVVSDAKEEAKAMGLLIAQEGINNAMQHAGIEVPTSLTDVASKLTDGSFGGGTVSTERPEQEDKKEDTTHTTTESSTGSHLPTPAKYNPADWMEDKYAKNYHPSKEAIEVLIDCVPQDDKTGGIDDDADVDHDVMGIGHSNSRTIPGFKVGPKGNIILTAAKMRLVKMYAIRRFKEMTEKRRAAQHQA